MSMSAASPALETAIARVQRLQAILCELTEMGMEFARSLHRQLLAGAAASDISDRFCGVAKAVRQLVALDARLGQALDDVACGRWAGEDAERQLRALAAQTRQDAAVEAIEKAIREAGDGEAVRALRERLDDWSCRRATERDFEDKPVAEILASACKHMGIPADPALLADETLTETLAEAVRAYAAAWQSAQPDPRKAPLTHSDADVRPGPSDARAPALAEGP